MSLPPFCSIKIPKFPKVTMSGKSTPGKTGRTAVARYSLQRQKDNEGVDDIRPTQDVVMCIPIGTKFKCEACWEVHKNISEHWRDYCDDAVAYNRLKNMFDAEAHHFHVAEYRKVATSPKGVPGSVILELDPTTWTLWDIIPTEEDDQVPWKGKSYLDLCESILTKEDEQEIESVEKITNFYGKAAKRAFHA